MAYQPNYVEIFHNGELVFTDKINFDNITGQVIIDVTSKKHIFNEISDSPAKFVHSTLSNCDLYTPIYFGIFSKKFIK